jgi:hypothetical protein
MNLKISQTEKQRIIELHNNYKSIMTEQMAQSYSTGQSAGRQAAQTVKGMAKDVAQVLKQIPITIGKTIFYMVVGTGVVLYMIGSKVFRVGLAASNALIKVLTATGKVVVGAAQTLGSAVQQGLTAAGIALNQGLQAVKQKISTIADNIIGVAKWCLLQMKQFGFRIYAQVLVGASQVKEFGAQISNWIASQWGTIQNQIGVAWDKAKSMGMQAIQNIKQNVQAAGQKIKQGIKQGVSSVGNAISQGAGAVSGFIKGMVEYFERIFGFEATTTLGLLRESMKYSGKEIIF